MMIRFYLWCASWSTLLKDEQGSWSSARVSWWLTLFFTLTAIVVDTLTPLDVPNPAYAILTTIVMFCGGWAAGPRVAQYLFPQIGASTRAVADAKRGLDDRRTDDERG